MKQDDEEEETKGTEETEATEGEEEEGAEGEAEGEEAEAEGEEEGEAAEETEHREDDKDLLVDGLPEKTKLKINRAIGKVVAREKKKSEAAEARAEAAEAKLKNASMEDPETRLPFPSDYVSADEVKTLKKADELKSIKRMLRPLRHEGYKGKDGTEYSASDVEARLDEIDEELEAILPKATTIRARAMDQFAADMKELRELRKQKAAGGGKPAVKPQAKKPPQAPGKAGSGGGGEQRKTQSVAGAIDEGAVYDMDSYKAQLRKAMGRK